MSLTILVRAFVRDGGVGRQSAIEQALRSVPRGRLDDYSATVGKYDHVPDALSIVMIREVGLGYQVDGVPCERLVAEDTLQAIRTVCPSSTVEVQTYELDSVKNYHAIESAPLALPFEDQLA